MFFILPLGVSGLSLEDIDPHLYEMLDEVSIFSLGVTFSEEPASSGIYRIGNLSDISSANIRRTLTAEYPEGIGYSFVWGGEKIGTPEAVILPVREASLVASDFTFTIYKNGVNQNLVLTVGAALQLDGDYPVSGWPINSTGADWLLVWSRVGSDTFNFYVWKELKSTSDASAKLIYSQAIQPPFGIGPDGNGRDQVSCNYTARVFRDSAEEDIRLIDEYISVYLEDQGLGAIDSSIFFGRAVSVPSTGEIIQVIATGGYPGSMSHDGGNLRPETFQIVTSGESYGSATSLALSVYKKLHGLNEIDLIGIT
jgi:hypothetical protein